MPEKLLQRDPLGTYQERLRLGVVIAEPGQPSSLATLPLFTSTAQDVTVETSQEKATSSERHRWQEERQKFHRRTQKVVSARWGHSLQPEDYSVSLQHNL